MGRIARSIGLLAVVALCGCSANVFSPAGVMVLPDKYSFSTCKELAVQRTKMAKREATLVDAMEKASTESGGFVVSAMAYRSELTQTRAELRVIDDTEREKKCPTTGR